jgi:hypothetical protein
MKNSFQLLLILSYLIAWNPLMGSSAVYPVASYSVPDSPWPESFGNHRAVMEINEKCEVAVIDIPWRRHDRDPQNRRFIIVESATGDTIPNIFRYHADNEHCTIAFGPVPKAGPYFFYYLPYEVQENWGFYGKDYLKPEKQPSSEWLSANRVGASNDIQSFAKAKLICLQSRTAFDSFYPMEIIPLKTEKQDMLAKYLSDYLVFSEDRRFPIRMKDEIPSRWVQKGPSAKFSGEACRNEYYVFQLGVYASKKDLQNVRTIFSPLKCGKNTLPASSFTCFNTGGTDPYGNSFSKKIDVKKGDVQVLWIGIDIPESTVAGTYRGSVTVKTENDEPRSIDVTLKIADNILPDRGDNETWRHSRLRWLNSTLGIDDNPTHGYEPIEYMGRNSYRLTDKVFTIAETGLPGSLKVDKNEILSGPVSFIAESESGVEKFSFPHDVTLLKNEPGMMSGSYVSSSPNLELNGTGTIESDGYINYRIGLTALNDIDLKDIRLEIPVSAEVAEYMMGMGVRGTTVPREIQSKWAGPHDSFWIGNAVAGIWCELRGGTYHGPLMNLYRPAPPASWYNDDKGGFRMKRDPDGGVKAVVFSGRRGLKKGEKIEFEWSLLLTPVKKIDNRSQFTDRYYHNGGNPLPSDSDLACGVKIVNLHHANNFNPHINYPFIAVDSMRWFVNKMHSKGRKVKIYYTIRELTNYTTELWALRSLGDEILGNGEGGGYPWLREHLINGYRPQWYQHFPDKSPDASVVNAPGDSRWYNYYIEGLAWLVRNVDIDGLYLDDVSYDRRTVKRIRKVLDKEKPGCLLDLHSNTGFSKGPATQYAEYFPYIDKLWFGESFQYDMMMPENWLVETSGIPFGLMGDMLQGGGNRWRGMVYGMTVRHPWVTETVKCDPRPVWEIWDKFGIERSVMKGYWDKDCPVKTDRDDIKATVYKKDGESLISVASWAGEPVKFSFRFDWNSLGLDKNRALLVAPFIKDFQEERVFQTGDQIPVEPGKGWLLLLKEEN